MEPSQQEELKQLIHGYEHLFPDIPTRTDKIYHDDIVEDSKPIKQHPYRMNPLKQKYLQDEVKYLLENDFIEPSQSNYSSPCIFKGGSRGGDRGSGPPPPLEFWQKSGYQIRDWDRFDIAQHLCKLQS